MYIKPLHNSKKWAMNQIEIGKGEDLASCPCVVKKNRCAIVCLEKKYAYLLVCGLAEDWLFSQRAECIHNELQGLAAEKSSRGEMQKSMLNNSMPYNV